MTDDQQRASSFYGPPLVLALIVPVVILTAVNQWRLSAEVERLEKLVGESESRQRYGIDNVLATQQKLVFELKDRIEEIRLKNLTYFPPSAFGKDDAQATFLVRQLRGFKAESLWALSEQKDASPTVRLLWVPETGRPTAVQLLPPDRLNAWFGLEYTQLAEPDAAGTSKIVKGKVTLLPDHAADLFHRLDEVGLWSAPATAG